MSLEQNWTKILRSSKINLPQTLQGMLSWVDYLLVISKKIEMQILK